MKRLFVLASLVVLFAASAVGVRAADNPAFGTWKLNVAKSKYTGVPAPKELTRKIEADGDGAKYTFTGTAADGSSLSYSFSTKFDGADSAVTGSVPGGFDAVALKKVNDHTYTVAQKKGGKTLSTGKAVVSKDGKTTTVTIKGKTADGKATSTVQVYDKE